LNVDVHEAEEFKVSDEFGSCPVRETVAPPREQRENGTVNPRSEVK